jgi:hypothetical protein
LGGDGNSPINFFQIANNDNLDSGTGGSVRHEVGRNSDRLLKSAKNSSGDGLELME